MRNRGEGSRSMQWGHGLEAALVPVEELAREADVGVGDAPGLLDLVESVLVCLWEQGVTRGSPVKEPQRATLYRLTRIRYRLTRIR